MAHGPRRMAPGAWPQAHGPRNGEDSQLLRDALLRDALLRDALLRDAMMPMS